mmetsp:Transcript_53136/g.172794  ORF Transcript_53136/g.172794 Transcript_53136/m.172794 type:complete len:496 (+) Transcript_53136:1657-3144(+)
MFQQTLMHTTLARLHIFAEIRDVVLAFGRRGRTQLDVLDALLHKTPQLRLATWRRDLIPMLLEARQDLSLSNDLLVLAMGVDLRFAAGSDTALHAVILVAGLQVHGHRLLAAHREAALGAVVLQALQHLRGPGRDGAAEHVHRLLTRVEDHRLQADIVRFQGALQQLVLPAFSIEILQVLPQAEVDLLAPLVGAMHGDVVAARGHHLDVGSKLHGLDPDHAVDLGLAGLLGELQGMVLQAAQHLAGTGLGVVIIGVEAAEELRDRHLVHLSLLRGALRLDVLGAARAYPEVQAVVLQAMLRQLADLLNASLAEAIDMRFLHVVPKTDQHPSFSELFVFAMRRQLGLAAGHDVEVQPDVDGVLLVALQQASAAGFLQCLPICPQARHLRARGRGDRACFSWQDVFLARQGQGVVESHVLCLTNLDIENLLPTTVRQIGLVRLQASHDHIRSLVLARAICDVLRARLTEAAHRVHFHLVFWVDPMPRDLDEKLLEFI